MRNLLSVKLMSQSHRSSRRVLGIAFEGMDVTFFATENRDEPLALSLTLAASPPLPQSLTSASLEPSSELGFSPDSRNARDLMSSQFHRD